MSLNIASIRRSQPAVILEKPLSKTHSAQIASQWFVAHALRNALTSLLTEHSSFSTTPSIDSTSLAYFATTETVSTPIRSDKWGFGWDWHSISRNFPTIESLYAEIHARRIQIEELKEQWRPYTRHIGRFDPIHLSLSELCSGQNKQGAYVFPEECLSPISDGISGSYFLSDENGNVRYVVKPIDEDICALNNRKGFSTPYTESTIRENMPLYLSSMREAMAYETARLIGVTNVAPRTTLAILESEAFYDQLDGIDPSERERYERMAASEPVREKLCSVQEFVPNSKLLIEGLHSLQMAGLSDEEIAARIDTRDFEDANILLWCTYDTDGHMGNFLVYPKSTDAIGNEILGIKKIDNGLAFPEKNEELRNNLRYLPNAKQPLTAEGQAKIAAIPIEALLDRLEQFGLEGSAEALKERLLFLKKLVAENPEITIKEIDRQMAGSRGIDDWWSSSS